LTASSTSGRASRHFRGFVIASLLAILCFYRPLAALLGFAVSSDLYSHILLLPFISVYLVWLERESLPGYSKPDYFLAVLFSASGLAALAFHFALGSDSSTTEISDSLSLTTLSFLLLFTGICAWFLGRPLLRSVAFPLAFLFLMVPLPSPVTQWIEGCLQSGSLAVAVGLFRLSTTPVFSSGLTIQLPDISLEVAPECSGLHSTLALFITSLLAGYLFLRSNWLRCVLAAAVVPLAFLRNGFRIYTIGELCVHVGPEMINSYIHRHGGPVFFILTLVPFLFLLFFLVRLNRGRLSRVQSSLDT
jgi:exosortase C (VPDSG-CTERM-specific)